MKRPRNLIRMVLLFLLLLGAIMTTTAILICYNGATAGNAGDSDDRTYKFDSENADVQLVDVNENLIGNLDSEVKNAYLNSYFKVYVSGKDATKPLTSSLDQSNGGAGYLGADVIEPSGTSTKLAQTFTPGVSGHLDMIKLYLSKQYSTTNGSMVVEIYSPTSGDPESGILLSKGSLNVSAVPSGFANYSWVEVNEFSPHPYLTSGEVYSIVLKPTGNWTDGDVYWFNENTYAKGSAYSYNSNTLTWSNLSWDHKFMTYMGTGKSLVSGSSPSSNELAIDPTIGSIVFDTSITSLVTVDYCLSFSLLGDINQDGKVNLLDLALLGQAWGSLEGEENYNSNADLNSDGVINLFDLAILGQNWNS